MNIRIVLVNPSHPGNIGAVARAMKTMGLENLYLVKPKIFPHVDATARATGADDILAKAIITASLSEALIGSKLVFGTSVRFRTLSLPKLELKAAAKIIQQEATNHLVTIIFGRENNGLTNAELELCNYQLYISTNPNFCSLNLAAAVQLVAYEINRTKPNNILPTTAAELATNEQLQALYQHLQHILVNSGFLTIKHPRKVLAKLKLLFNRAQLEENEVQILRGILTAIQTKITHE